MAETESAPAAAEVPAVDPTQPPSKENELTYEFEVIILLYAIVTLFFRNTKTTSSKISPKSKIEKFLTTVPSSAFLEKSEFAFRAAFRQFRSPFRNSTANSTALKRR